MSDSRGATSLTLQFIKTKKNANDNGGGPNQNLHNKLEKQKSHRNVNGGRPKTSLS